MALLELGTPSDGLFDYPVEKRRTRGHITAMRKAEQHLDALWKHLDDHVAAQAYELRTFGFSSFGKDERKLQRTPAQVDPSVKAKMERPQTTYTPLRQNNGPNRRSARTVGAEKRIKPKTRGVARPPPSTTTAAALQPSSSPSSSPSTTSQTPLEPPTLVFSDRALQVFSVLFHIPALHSKKPGEIPWSDFLHAMASAGFAIEKLYGSVWQFTPAKLDVGRSIQFHEPHPQGKIPFVVGRRIGRRLERAYGWSGETFRAG